MKKAVLLILLIASLRVQVEAQQVLLANNASTLSERTSASSTAIVSTSHVLFRFMAFDQSNYINEIDQADAGNHFLGDYVAKKLYLVKKMYTYKEAVAPGNSATKTVYRKPDIYFSIKKIERHLKESVKKELLSPEMAKDEYNKVLDIALNVLEEDTKGFERRINSVNGNATELLKIFVNEVELNN